MEGGVATVNAEPSLFPVMWAAATDGQQWGQAAGPSYQPPDDIAERVRAGDELGSVMNEALGREDVGRRGGAAAALTGDRVDRETALSTAVAGALDPFVVDHYD